MLGSLLLKLYRISIKSCSFPDTWKLAHITPIPKKGNRANATNYRGISILCASSKIFESIVHSHILFIARDCIIPQQHGFFPKRSTLTNLISLTSVITSSLDSGSQVDIIYTDFKAAFDRIPHPILLAKLSKLGFIDSHID